MVRRCGVHDMKFDADIGDTGLVRDATGALLFSPVRGDTETGRAVCVAMGSTPGEPMLAEDGSHVRVACLFRAPLTVEPLPEGFSQRTYRGPWAEPIESKRLRSTAQVLLRRWADHIKAEQSGSAQCGGCGVYCRMPLPEGLCDTCHADLMEALK
jgi:hypothetical protein